MVGFYYAVQLIAGHISSQLTALAIIQGMDGAAAVFRILTRRGFYLQRKKLLSSCEIEDLIETHLGKLCVITPIARVTGCACSNEGFKPVILL